MTKRTTPLVIGIAGGTGSGKTTIANVILGRVGNQHITYLPHDAYYKDLKDLPVAQRDMINFDHPDSLDTSLLIEHIQAFADTLAMFPHFCNDVVFGGLQHGGTPLQLPMSVATNYLAISLMSTIGAHEIMWACTIPV